MSLDGQDVFALSAVVIAAGWLLVRLRSGASQPSCAKCAVVPATLERGQRSARLRVL